MVNSDIASLVASSIRFCAASQRAYDLHAWVVMPNHVHMLVTPQVSPAKFMCTLKGYTAHEANKLLGRVGQQFWQRESYDHWVRGDEQFKRIVRDIEENPVQAGLVQKSGDYLWSSAHEHQT